MNKINSYTNNGKLNLDKVMDDFTPYLKTVINNYAIIELSDEDIEEILIDTFLVLWKNYSKGITYLESYLAGIAKNLVRERIRKYHFTYDISDYENIIPCYDNINFISEQREKIRQLKISYKSLNEIDFKILNMFYYHSKSTKEISKELNMSETNIRTKLVRIRKKLKKYLS